VVAQQENYRKSGFVLAHNNIRFGGKVETKSQDSSAITAVTPALAKAAADYDRGFFPDERGAFLNNWLTGSGTRHALVFMEGGSPRGYGVIRACREGQKIGPLFADSAAVATSLFKSLAASAEAGNVFLDVPEPNADAIRLAESFGLQPVFETARMYRGPNPELPLDRIFGITTFELG
jgi:hypothetical protein